MFFFVCLAHSEDEGWTADVMSFFNCAFSKVQSANGVGDSFRAREASKKARLFNIIGLVCGVILTIIVLAVQLTKPR